MEDYKEKYEQAMLRMNKWVEGSEIIEPKEVAEFVFPELKKSEDDKIREWIINYLEVRLPDAGEFLDEYIKAIAWLEKQGEPLCWIKCSDELPNRNGTYLVVTDGSHNDIYDIAKYDSIEGWHKASEINYWMPIPQLNNENIIEKPTCTWSEEDEYNFNWIIEDYKKAMQTATSSVWEGRFKMIVDWLKSLKEKMKGE